MSTEESGPGGPDHEPEPCEIAACDAAPDQPIGESACFEDTGNCGDAQCCLCQGGSDEFVYDSGWEDCASGFSLRVVFALGPPSPTLRAWVRQMMLQPGRDPVGFDGAEE